MTILAISVQWLYGKNNTSDKRIKKDYPYDKAVQIWICFIRDLKIRAIYASEIIKYPEISL